MQANAHTWVPRQAFDERQIGLAVSTLEYRVEIADRLMRVN
jgi:hypothetical protein